MKLYFEKGNGLVPAIIQDGQTKKVLMLGYMNREALEKTQAERKVTFFSRSKNRLWTKGETSGNFLHVENIIADCDQDALLIQVRPDGPVCHLGTDTCWGEENKPEGNFLKELEAVIADRQTNPKDDSYTSKLFRKGVNKIAQKVGEEAVELIIESKDSDDEKFLGEAADLLFHYLVLLNVKGKKLENVVEILKQRKK